MKKALIKIIIGVILLLMGVISFKSDKEVVNDFSDENKYVVGYTFNDGKRIHMTYDISYNDGSLIMAFSNYELLLDEFIEKLDYVDSLKDGGTKIYKYNKDKKIFGDEEFYVAVCNSFDNNNDIYVSKYRENLGNECVIKYNQLEGVSLSIKDDTLTSSGLVVVITDTSGKDNIYGEFYRIDEKINGEWVSLNPIIDNYAFNSMGYKVNDDNILELNVNWEWLYGKLEEGEYRIVKAADLTNHFITTEFIIK